MAEIILHHYPLSPFSEKVRKILAYKRIPWCAVEQPMMAPKPDLTPLTGGYRRIPVLQIGADVYCDTACILNRLEREQAEPPCIPAGLQGVAEIIADWADHQFFFQTVPPVVVELLPVLPPGFTADRAAMSPNLTEEAFTKGAPHALTQVILSLARLDAQLRDRPFLLGEHFTFADAACFHPVWFLKNSPKLFALVAERPALAAWFERIDAFGPGDVRAMDPAAALAIARDGAPADLAGGECSPSAGVSVGDEVSIVADDYGVERSAGKVVRLLRHEIAIQRADPALGEIAVHFPLAGYRITRV